MDNLESYLSAIEAELKDVPAARRAEFVDEMRAHLGAMFQAKRADGDSSHAAWLQVAAEFGEPDKVGRELRAQWASSGQLETEGTPLSLGRKVRMFALPVVACVVAYAMLTWMRAPEHNLRWHIPLLAVLAFGSLVYGISSDVRKRGGWKPSTVVGFVGAIIILSNAIFTLSRNGDVSEWHAWSNFAFILIWASLGDQLRKRERADRPWQFSSIYKSSPIAAEQAYRLSPIVGLAMGTVLSGIGIITLGSQFFGLPLAFLSCAGLIGAAVIYARYLTK